MNSDFWKRHDPETGEPNIVKFLRQALDLAQAGGLRERILVEAQ